MLDEIERVVPEPFDRLRRIPLAVRLGLLALLLGGASLAGRSGLDWASVWHWLGASVAVTRWTILATLLICPIAAIGVAAALPWGLRRRRLSEFYARWEAFRGHFELLYLHVEHYLKQPPEKGLSDDLRVSLEAHWPQRARLRELLFLLGEDTLDLISSRAWGNVKAQDEYLRQTAYRTPFSFLLDIGPPIGMINHHGYAVWGALFVSDEYIEHLRYRYPHLRRMGVKSGAGTSLVAAMGDE